VYLSRSLHHHLIEEQAIEQFPSYLPSDRSTSISQVISHELSIPCFALLTWATLLVSNAATRCFYRSTAYASIKIDTEANAAET
jgi:hypothetical protein